MNLSDLERMSVVDLQLRYYDLDRQIEALRGFQRQIIEQALIRTERIKQLGHG